MQAGCLPTGGGAMSGMFADEGEGRHSRRRFIRTLALGGAVSVVTGARWSAHVVAAVRPASTSLGFARVRLRVADFPPLTRDFGSVRVGFTGLNVIGPVPPFIVTRDGAAWHAVSSECTHAGCIIPAFSSSNKVAVCPCHGSAYAVDGHVIRGPATLALTSYPVREGGDGTLTLEMAEFPEYDVAIEQVASAPPARLGLTFFALRNLEYEIYAAAGAAGPWEKRSFATTPAGAVDRTLLTGTGVPTTVYVERTADVGLFSVGARVKAV